MADEERADSAAPVGREGSEYMENFFSPPPPTTNEQMNKRNFVAGLITLKRKKKKKKKLLTESVCGIHPFCSLLPHLRVEII